MIYISKIVFMAVSLAMLVSGCGFQMRGEWQLPASVQNLLRFKVVGADGNVLVKEQQINMVRDYPFISTEAGGAYNEELLLRDNMYKDMARQIMRRIQAQAS